MLQTRHLSPEGSPVGLGAGRTVGWGCGSCCAPGRKAKGTWWDRVGECPQVQPRWSASEPGEKCVIRVAFTSHLENKAGTALVGKDTCWCFPSAPQMTVS